jgi:hypothetical protein
MRITPAMRQRSSEKPDGGFSSLGEFEIRDSTSGSSIRQVDLCPWRGTWGSPGRGLARCEVSIISDAHDKPGKGKGRERPLSLRFYVPVRAQIVDRACRKRTVSPAGSEGGGEGGEHGLVGRIRAVMRNRDGLYRVVLIEAVKDCNRNLGEMVHGRERSQRVRGRRAQRRETVVVSSHTTWAGTPPVFPLATVQRTLQETASTRGCRFHYGPHEAPPCEREGLQG